MTLPPRRAVRHASVVGVAAIVSGIGSYALIVITARSVGPEAYSSFAVFWSLAVIAGLGLYFPIEQETAREAAAGASTPGKGLAPIAVRTALAVTVLAAAASLALFTPAGLAYIGDATLAVALLAVLAASAVQFPVRGLLSGAALRERYAAVITTEGLLRTLLPGVFLVAGVTDAATFAFAIAAAALIAVVPALLGRNMGWMHRRGPSFMVFVRRTGGLVVAALAIQLLLNSPVLIAGAAADAASFAGAVLASLTIARIPVFVYAVAQVMYMPAVAGVHGRGDRRRLMRVAGMGLGGAVVVAIAIVVVMGVAGEWIVSLLFGPGLAMEPVAQLLVGGAVGMFFIAQVASDTALALSAHRALVRSWIIAAAVALGVALVVPDALLRAVLPLAVGAAVASAQLLVVLWMRVRTMPQLARAAER